VHRVRPRHRTISSMDAPELAEELDRFDDAIDELLAAQ
jgi:hypothetical protein